MRALYITEVTDPSSAFSPCSSSFPFVSFLTAFLVTSLFAIMASFSAFQARSQQDNVVEESSVWFNELMRKALPNSFAPDTKLSSKQKKDLRLFLDLFRDVVVPAEIALHKKAWDTTPSHPLFDLAQPGLVFQPSAHGQPPPGPVHKRRADDEIIGQSNANGPAIKRRKTSSNASAQAGSASGSSMVRMSLYRRIIIYPDTRA